MNRYVENSVILEFNERSELVATLSNNGALVKENPKMSWPESASELCRPIILSAALPQSTLRV
jgi:hypothetical protein